MSEDMKLILDEMRAMEGRLNNRMDAMDKQFGEVNRKLQELDQKIDAKHQESINAFANLANMIDDFAKKIDDVEKVTVRNTYDIALLKAKGA